MSNIIRADVRTSTRTIETVEVDLSTVNIDAASEVELILSTPDGRFHKVRVNSGWFVPTYGARL